MVQPLYVIIRQFIATMQLLQCTIISIVEHGIRKEYATGTYRDFASKNLMCQLLFTELLLFAYNDTYGTYIRTALEKIGYTMVIPRL